MNFPFVATAAFCATSSRDVESVARACIIRSRADRIAVASKPTMEHRTRPAGIDFLFLFSLSLSFASVHVIEPGRFVERDGAPEFTSCNGKRKKKKTEKDRAGDYNVLGTRHFRSVEGGGERNNRSVLIATLYNVAQSRFESAPRRFPPKGDNYRTFSFSLSSLFQRRPFFVQIMRHDNAHPH